MEMTETIIVPQAATIATDTSGLKLLILSNINAMVLYIP
jgi:hypothetical protein